MGIIILYMATRALACLGSLTAFVTLVVMGHPYWAIYPAVLSLLTSVAAVQGYPEQNEKRNDLE